MRVFSGRENRAIAILLFSVAPLCLANPVIRKLGESREYSSQLRDLDHPKDASIITHIWPSHNSGNRPQSKMTGTDISPAIYERNSRTTDQLLHLSPSLDERRALSDITTQGFKWIWEKAEVILDSVEAFNKHHSMYEDVIRQTEVSSGNEVLRFAASLVITYGSLRMMFENLPNGHGSAEEFIKQFAMQMLSLCTVGMVYGTYKVAAMMLSTTVWVTLQIMEYGPIPELIG